MMRILGLISGTSHDGIDAAVVRFEPVADGLEVAVESTLSVPYDSDLRVRLTASLPPMITLASALCQLDTDIGRAFADVAERACAAAAGKVDLIVSHGQTIFHWVDGNTVRGTLQIGQPAWIAERTGTPVLSDMRIRDITAGGQGAPLASALDVLLLAGRAGTRGALNLGGISNVTIVGAGEPLAFDIGPANALLDAMVSARKLHPSGYDCGGVIAASGRVDPELLALALEEPYYALAPPKTTGKELFHGAYADRLLARSGRDLSDADLVATLTELTVQTVAAALYDRSLVELFVSGGGVHNETMMAGLRRALPATEVRNLADLGLDSDGKEAVLMALIGWLGWHGIAATVPSATGAQGARQLGSFTPGAVPLRLPEPVPRPNFLRVLEGDDG